jgi:hypothetical protein
MVSMHSIQGNLRKNGEFINNQGGALLHHNSPIPWSTFAQYLTQEITFIEFIRKSLLLFREVHNLNHLIKTTLYYCVLVLKKDC